MDAPLTDNAPGWGLGPIEPTNLVVPWPHRQIPSPADLVREMSARLGAPVAVLEPVPAGDDAIAWCAAVSLPHRATPVLLWDQPAHAASPDDPPEVRAAGAVRVLGIETPLDARDALTDYTNLLTTIVRGVPELPAVLDVNVSRWHVREGLERTVLAEAIDPPAELLWVTRAETAGAGDAAWLRTHGLARCGLPELEMLEVPRPCVDTAVALVDLVAALLVERGAPPPGTALEMGPGVDVTLQPRRETEPFARAGAAPRDVPVAVICAAAPRGAYRRVWPWPEDAVRRLMSAEGTAVYLTERASRRQAQLARSTWDRFTHAFAGRAGDARFVVKGAFDGEGATREHVWVEVTRCDDAGAAGRLLDAPRHLALGAGDAARVDVDRVSDWRVITPDGAIGPEAAEALASGAPTLDEQ